MKKYLMIIAFALTFVTGFAQEKKQINEEDYTNQQVEMADSFRDEGKIYVVIAIILVILSVLVGYMIKVDNKVSKLEKEIDEIEDKKQLA
ncbi:CcmD family protein [Aureibacter tunicatorum]|uniref:Membrane protein n=1 Tax=Aureibacter tunicatorum TaxID=866807 RepID=A0AAE4BTN4_9BACT|nr:CcmD family protein [Aureibacter tunicatorum]MDR6240145.1 putative membrane protein [Aureibacter tunicatorum]BDD05974.1 hypothetical protein AUTU_34570 [Aureibacter tunicatorum]